jgi:hypothetical protein
MNEDFPFSKFMITINGPEVLGRGMDREYNTDSWGRGYIHVYGVIEGTTPSFNDEVRHTISIGEFQLRQKQGKSMDEFLQEVREGLAKVISEYKL